MPRTDRTTGNAARATTALRRGCAALCLLVLCTVPAAADQLDIDIHGIKNSLLENVRNRVGGYEARGEQKLSRRRLQHITEAVERETRRALRPFGYYHPEVHTELKSTGENSWRLDVQVDRGPPLKVSQVTVELRGPGKELDELQDWRDDWPLDKGDRLEQKVWEDAKTAAMDIAEAKGFLSARFVEHRIALDLERNEAALTLVLDSGPRAVFGEVGFDQEVVRNEVLANLPRFERGQPYDSWLIERFRLDLWRTGYFDDIEINEERHLDETPPRVDLTVDANMRNRDTYQGSIGYGTDTGVRAQVRWNRHLLSSRGDSLDMGLGWQQRNNEYSFRSSYKLPRRTRAREFWTADLFLRRENQDLKVKPEGDEADFVKLANGDATDYSVKAGRRIERDLASGYTQLFETWYVQFVLEDNTFGESTLVPPGGGPPLAERDIEEFDQTDSSVALGVNWDWPVIRGSGFETTGHHERAWLFTANEAWGSGKEFTQAYLSSSWHTLFGDRFKLLLRGEIGYSNAHVDKLDLDLGDRTLDLSVTQLPNLYRFKAGGSRSVRGYAFESLNDNGLGSNNIVTGSAEVEMKIRRDWSVAAFIDAGNAFNSWSDFKLRRGVGVGVRWYSIVGAVRVDVAKALDFDGEPWRLHFTIGTPLL